MLSDKAIDDLNEKIRDIPHLRLNLKFDHVQMLEEYRGLADLNLIRPYHTVSNFPRVQKHLARWWWGVGLLTPGGDPYECLQESKTMSNAPMRPSPLANQCPHLMDIVAQLGTGFVGSARIMLIQPGGTLTWHSHYLDYRQSRPEGPDGIVVHVPIVQPERFRYSVINVWDYKTQDVENVPLRVYSQNYPVAEPTVFNSYHMHNVFNPDTYARVSLMVYLNLRFDRTADLVADAVSRYAGDYVEWTSDP